MAEQRQNNVALTDEEKEQRAKKRNRTIVTVVSVAAAVLIVVIVLLLLLVKCEPEENVDPPVGHTHTYSSWVVVDEPTCTEEGLRERTCSCGEKETEMIAALGHTAGEAVRENEKAPTCTEKGSYEEVVSCTVCEEEVSRKTVEVAALGHTAGEAEKENEVAATCLDAGSYEEVVCCTVCGEELSRKTVTVDALGHDYKGVVTDEALCLVPGEMTYTCTRCVDSYTEEIAPLRHSWGETKPGQAPTCTSAGYTSYETCTRCGYSNRDIIPAAGHTWGEWVETTAATCTTTGVEERFCSACGKTETKAIDALDHAWGDPTWSWEDDYTSATATFICVRGCEEKETAVITSTTTATCETAGDTTYTATVTFNGQDYTDKQEVKTEAVGHVWSEQPTWEWTDDHNTARATFICVRGCEKTETAVITSTTTATCETPGITTYIATATFNGQDYTDKQEVDTDPLGHAWSAYSSDKNNHWRECTREECSAKEEEAHSFTGNTCDACGYTYYSEGLDYEVNGDTVTITGLGTCSDKPIYIPAVIEDKPVTEIGDYAFQYKYGKVSEVVLPDSVTTIGREAFAGCYITEIDIPNSVKTIDSGAFSACYRLTDIDLPDGLTEIANNMFSNSTILASIVIPESVTSIGTSAFANTALKEIKIPDNVTRIGGSAFDSVTELTTVHFSENSNLTTIGSYAFKNCTSLTSLTIPKNVTEIDSDIFKNTDSVTSVTFLDPSDWWVYTEKSYDTPDEDSYIQLRESDLANSATACEFLKDTYSGSYIWTKTPPEN